MVRADAHRVADVSGAIAQIERRTAGLDATAAAEDESVQVWVLCHIAIIGEALRTLSPDIQAAHPTIHWGGPDRPAKRCRAPVLPPVTRAHLGDGDAAPA